MCDRKYKSAVSGSSSPHLNSCRVLQRITQNPKLHKLTSVMVPGPCCDPWLEMGTNWSVPVQWRDLKSDNCWRLKCINGRILCSMMSVKPFLFCNFQGSCNLGLIIWKMSLSQENVHLKVNQLSISYLLQPDKDSA